MKYLILGDVHACWYAMAKHVIENVINRGLDFDAIIQVGDFGYYKDHIDGLFRYLPMINKPIHFVCGNHEDHLYLHQTYKNLPKSLIYHPRGDITILEDGTKIGWFGGACNVDRPQEIYPNGIQNFPSNKEALDFAQKVNTLGGVDLLITHSCPHSIGVKMQGLPAFEPLIAEFIHKLGLTTGPITDCGEESLTTLWNALTVKPSEVSFGHFHQIHHTIFPNGTHFRCVGTCDTIENKIPPIFFYDSSTKKVTP